MKKPQCRKIPFASKGEAEKEGRANIARFRRRKKAKSDFLIAYRCNACSLWHLTSSKPRGK